MTRTIDALSVCILFTALLTQAASADRPGLRPAEPIVCAGNSDLVVRDRLIETSGNGILVQGNCDVAIVGSHIVAGGVGVLVQGNGGVEITGSTIEGEQASLAAVGNGEIRYRQTELRGATYTAGQGQITGDDDAIHGGGLAAGILGKVRVGLGGILVQDGDSTVSIGPGGVVVSDGADTVSVKTGPGGVHVEADDVAVIVDADVTIEGGLLRLGVGASVQVSGSWRTAGHSPYRAADTDRLLLELGATDQDGLLRLGLAGDILFDLDSATIQPPGTAELSKLAHVLRQRAAGEIRLVGHTDSLGSDEHNRKLSQARAVAVMRWLNAEEGIPAQLMVGEGMGAKQPVAYNTMPDGSDNPAGRARNRRVEIFFAPQS